MDIIRSAIKAELTRRNLSAYWLANQTGGYASNIYAYLSGKRDVYTETANRYLEALGMTIEARKKERKH